MFKTKDGVKLKELIRRTINEEPIETDYDTTSLFNNIKVYDTFLLINKKAEVIYANIMSSLYLYIDRKTKAYK